jgi:hypothetical protein
MAEESGSKIQSFSVKLPCSFHFFSTKQRRGDSVREDKRFVQLSISGVGKMRPDKNKLYPHSGSLRINKNPTFRRCLFSHENFSRKEKGAEF